MARVQVNPARRARRLAIYNHKGGVGKTTLTVNIAAAIAEQGKRVLLVDSDPQCNLTSCFLKNEEVDRLLDTSDDKNDGQTVWSAMKPFVDGEGNVKIVTPTALFEKRQFLIPGDIRMSEFERELSDFWAQSLLRRPRGYRGAFALSSLVNEVAKKHEIDFVFYDVGPNIGPLNRIVLLDCDFFIVPAACDLFSLRALRTLGRTLYSWIDEWRVISELAPEGAPLLPGRPKFLGYIPQQFRVYGGEITGNHQRYLSQIEKEMRNQVAGIIKKLDSSLVLPPTGSKLGEVRDYGTIVATSQQEHVPIARVAGAPNALGAEAKKTFALIARKIIERTKMVN